MLLPSKYVRYVFFYLAIVNSLGVGAQNTANPSTYALLWEISGRDLSQPSFLFGSMHVRESAAFNFPDSLGGYLRSCTAFANEVHLDSAMIRMLEVYLGKEEPQIDEDYLRALSTIKVGEDFMPPRTGATKTPSLWSSLTRQLGHKRDTIHYPTFLDAYLMEYARCQGLRLYGLEEIDEHLYEPGDESGKGFSIFERALFQLQDYYYAGDITEIGYLVAEQGPHFDQMALVPRNYVMCRRIKEILRTEKALFAVVGAAHLPGKTGLVQLLREEGYQLRPIPADRDSRSPADSLLGKILCQREWPKQVGGRGGYHFTFPFAQCFERSAGASSQYLGYDIGQGLSYLLLTDRFLPYQFEDFETRFFTDDGYQIEANEPITVAGLEGRRYELFRPDED
ncbi:MAG: TraB/GumN family protein, partial [Bacteroidetes bacterium]